MSTNNPSLILSSGQVEDTSLKFQLPLPIMGQGEVSGHAVKICHWIKDRQWVTMALQAGGVASSTCQFVGGEAAHISPLLGAILAPLYFPHAVACAKEHLGFAKEAIDAKDTAMGLFWAGMSLDSIVVTLRNIGTFLQGGVSFLNQGSTVFSLILSSFAMPISLLAVGVIESVWQGWLVGRGARALHKFQKISKNDLESLQETMKGTLKSMTVGPAYLKEMYQGDHFTSKTKMEAVQEEIQGLPEVDASQVRAALGHVKGLSTIHCLQHLTELRPLLEEMDAFEKLYEQAEKGAIEELIIEKTLSIYARLETMKRSPELEPLFELIAAHKKTFENCQEYLRGAKHLTKEIRNEIIKVLICNLIFLFAALIAVTIGVFTFSYPQMTMLLTSLSLASSGILIATVLIKKTAEAHTHTPKLIV